MELIDRIVDEGGQDPSGVAGLSDADPRQQRLLGYVPWNPGPARALLDDVYAVLVDYRAQLPLAIRQVYYLLLRRGYPKGKPFERRLGYVFNRARRAGLIPFEWVRDDTTSVFEGEWHDSLDAFEREQRARARAYTVNTQADQRQVIEVHLEARGMGPQVYRLVAPFCVKVYPAGGYAHLTGKHELAARICARDEKQTVVLSLGDFDPHGLTMFENIRDDVTAFVAADRRPMTPPTVFERVALTLDQVEMFDLAHEPYRPKPRDYRGQRWPHDWVVQLEALPPNTLEELLTTVIRSYLDGRRYAASLRRQVRERRELARRARALPKPRG
jgi:hypothetical protein